MKDQDLMIQVLSRGVEERPVVRITHLPTGLVAASCTKRTLMGNKVAAMKMLKGLLHERGQA
jgi:protein subunit release factor A